MEHQYLNKRTDYKKITKIVSCCVLVSCVCVSEIFAQTGIEVINGVFDDMKTAIMTKLIPVSQLLIVGSGAYGAYKSSSWIHVVGGGIGAALVEVLSRGFGA
jgi:hypothetical protein